MPHAESDHPAAASPTRRRAAARLSLVWGCTLALTGCGEGGRDEAPGSSASPSPEKPNVLLISLDTLRADHLSCYGNPNRTSPRIDALAEAGTRVREAWSTTSWTLPSHVSMLTGLPISVHGICDSLLWSLPDRRAVPIRGVWLPEVLQEEGYRTAGFFSWKYLERQFGFGVGFDTWERVAYSPATLPGIGEELARLRKAGDLDGARELMLANADLMRVGQPTSDDCVDSALSWLDDAAGDERPFFLFVHLFDVHDPYTPPAPYDRAFDAEYEGPIDGHDVLGPKSRVRRGMPEADLRHLKALYDGEIAWVDFQVGRLLDRLEDRGLQGDTLVVITGDHGEEFFEHGMKTHREQLHRESVHVPLILHLPGVVPEGLEIDGAASLCDVLPTVLSICGAELPPAVWGRNLLDPGDERSPRRPVYTELLAFPSKGPPARHLGIRSGDDHWLWVRSAEGESLHHHDLSEDPLGQGPGRALDPASEEGRAFLDRVDGLREELAAVRASVPRRDILVTRNLDAVDLAELAALGYVSGTIEPGTLESEDPEKAVEEHLCLDGCLFHAR